MASSSAYSQGWLHTSQESAHSQDTRNHLHSLQGKNREKSSQAQNVKAARLYVFGDGNMVEDDEEVTEFEMRSRHKNAPAALKEEPRPLYFVREVYEGDTLQAIALKYSCNVSIL